MKRVFYILCFSLLGFLLQLIVHAIVETAVLTLLLKDFGRYGLGLTWSQWYAVHHTLTLAFTTVGLALGFRWGVKWWQILYVEKRYGWPPRWKARPISKK